MTASPTPRPALRLDFDRARYPSAWLATHPTEAQVQDAVCAYLRSTGWTVAVIDAGGRGLRNGGATRKAPAPTGFPDVYAKRPGQTLHVECKRPEWLYWSLKRNRYMCAQAAGKVTPEQRVWLRELADAGALVCVAWHVDDVIEAIEGTR